jgi:peptide/nickel transport system substrate-binding protein
MTDERAVDRHASPLSGSRDKVSSSRRVESTFMQRFTPLDSFVAVLRLGGACAVACAVLSATACARVTSQSNVVAEHPWTVPGVLRWGEFTEPDTLNPMLSSLQVSVEESMLWAGYLFEYDDRNEFVPELATQMPTVANGGISRDGMAITYHLRPGVRWQDGAPFGADDVIFSWRAVMNPRNNVEGRVGYELIRSIDKIDDYTIVVHLTRPFAPFTATFFTMGAFAYAVLPKHLLAGLPDINRAQYNLLPIGTGPFRVVSYRHGQDLKLEANPLYWRGPPKLREVDVTYFNDQNTILTQLRTHEVDLVTNVALSRIPDLLRIDGVTVHGIPFTYFKYLGFNLEKVTLRDARVRRALTLATDRMRIIRDVTHGFALEADSDQPPFLWAHAAGLPQPVYNPAAASRLLDSAGWRLAADGYRYRNGVKLELVMSGTVGDPADRSVEQIVQEEWRTIGVSVIIKNAADSVLYAPASYHGVYATGSFDVMINGWFNGVDPDDSALLTCHERPPNGDNYVRLCDPRVDAAEERALASNDRIVRSRAYADIQRYLAEDCPMVFLWFAKRVDATNPDLKGYLPAHAVTTLWNTWDWSI